ncbi:ABC1-domain-containing protein [Fistulina hepatica ATCC 64428]|uniref:ABC1-domain-containing protein n=1 Tax=Fistulina hepatica ATCC 64428 TaxID=1128425 RepID=A0A0D7AKH2_9AGAR|nr:ABC1-domain-containing protein [Fistulina hepatica ATCC 64428]
MFRLSTRIHSSCVRHLSSSAPARKWSSRNIFPSFFVPSPITRYPIQRRTLLWLLPIAGVSLLAFLPQDSGKPFVLSLFASSEVIPVVETLKIPPPIIYSPSDGSATTRLWRFVLDKIWEPILTSTRFVYLLILFTPVIICSPALLVTPPEAPIWWYDLLVYTMETAGPTFIKLAQWAASRKDLFPAELCQRLGTLHSNAKPHSLAYTKMQIETVFHRPFEEIFDEFNETPIGVGAIAQVYKARLKPDLVPPSVTGPRRRGSKFSAAVLSPEVEYDVPKASVAIKILHPRVEKTITRDLRIMSFFAHALTALVPGVEWLSLPEEVAVFGNMMFQQLDLRHEAENLLAFERNFSRRPLPVTFPRPLVEWSTKAMLVEEYEKALPLEEFLRSGGGPYDVQLATIGLDVFLNMLLLDNFVHSDLHPGNIMVKFSQPLSMWDVLEKAYNGLAKKGYIPFVTPSPVTEADRDSDAVVDHLRTSPETWVQDLMQLHAAGYVPEVVLLDAGLVTTLNATNRTNFLDLFRAIAEFDGYRAGQLMVQRSRTPHLAIDVEMFALKMQRLVLSVKRKTFSLGEIRISDVLSEVLQSVRQHHVKMEGDFVNTVLSILLLEGIGRQLNPDMDLFQSALPILRQVGGQMANKETAMQVGRDLPHTDLGAFLKVWVWLEAREFITAAYMDQDEMIAHDW